MKPLSTQCEIVLPFERLIYIRCVRCWATSICLKIEWNMTPAYSHDKYYVFVLLFRHRITTTMTLLCTMRCRSSWFLFGRCCRSRRRCRPFAYSIAQRWWPANSSCATERMRFSPLSPTSAIFGALLPAQSNGSSHRPATDCHAMPTASYIWLCSHQPAQ